MFCDAMLLCLKFPYLLCTPNESASTPEGKRNLYFLCASRWMEPERSLGPVLCQSFVNTWNPGPLLKSPNLSPSSHLTGVSPFSLSFPWTFSEKVITSAQGRRNHQNKHCSHTSLICLPMHSGHQGEDFSFVRFEKLLFFSFLKAQGLIFTVSCGMFQSNKIAFCWDL